MTLYPPIHVCQFVLQWLAAGTGEPGPHFGKHQSTEIECLTLLMPTPIWIASVFLGR